MSSTAELLLLADRQRPRAAQREIGMSDLGACRRRTGYKMAGFDPVNEVGSVQAVMGSAIHDMVADILRSIAQPGDLVEHEVRYAGILGHLDRYEAETQTVVDTKTTSSRWLEHIKLHGPEHAHLWQVSCYGAALITEGIPVKRVRIEYLARDTGEEYVWPSIEGRPINPQDVRDALNWLRMVRDTPLEMLPRDYEPDSVYCRGCPFGGMDGGICWEGHIPGRDLRSVLYVENPDAEMWAEQLWQAREARKEAEKAEAEARGALTAVVYDHGKTVKIGDRYLRLTANGQMKFVSGPRKVEISA